MAARMLALARLQDKGSSFRRRIRAAGRGLPVSASPGTPAAIRGRPADPHACRQDADALELLARRMPGGESRADWLMRELRGHFSSVMEIYERVVRSQTPAAELRCMTTASHRSVARPSNVVLALDQRAPALAAALAPRASATGLSRFRAFSRAPVGRSGSPGPAERRHRAGRAHAGFVRAQPLLRRRADSHAGAGGRDSALPQSPWRWRSPLPHGACRSCAAGFAARCCAFRPKAYAAPIPSSTRWRAPRSWPTR